MRIHKYSCREVEEPGWDFDQVKFDRINLLVGDTATGKTRLLNTIFNLGLFAASNRFKNGFWEIEFSHAGREYLWTLETEKRNGESAPGVIVRDVLLSLEDDQRITLVERKGLAFKFLQNTLPKLSQKETGIWILKGEDLIRPIHEAFSIIQRRRFFHDELLKITEVMAVPRSLLDELEDHPDLDKLFHVDLNLGAKLYILSEYFRELYSIIIDQYRRFFPFVEEARFTDLSQINPNLPVAGPLPVFNIRERRSHQWIPIMELSSGMQKVLLILTDIFIMPEGGVYLIDEYENSLGINAIDFFPEFVLELEKDIQFLITSHHPYIINEIPPANWFIFHRIGMRVRILHGDHLIERFGKSKQKAFVQLINDPFFSEGVE